MDLISNLPFEIIQYILEELPFRSLLSLTQTSTNFEKFCNDNQLWYRLLRKDFNFTGKYTKERIFKEKYKIYSNKNPTNILLKGVEHEDLDLIRYALLGRSIILAPVPDEETTSPESRLCKINFSQYGKILCQGNAEIIKIIKENFEDDERGCQFEAFPYPEENGPLCRTNDGNIFLIYQGFSIFQHLCVIGVDLNNQGIISPLSPFLMRAFDDKNVDYDDHLARSVIELKAESLRVVDGELYYPGHFRKEHIFKEVPVIPPSRVTEKVPTNISTNNLNQEFPNVKMPHHYSSQNIPDSKSSNESDTQSITVLPYSKEGSLLRSEDGIIFKIDQSGEVVAIGIDQNNSGIIHPLTQELIEFVQSMGGLIDDSLAKEFHDLTPELYIEKNN